MWYRFMKRKTNLFRAAFAVTCITLLFFSCGQKGNRLHLQLDGLTDSLVILRWHGDSVTRSDTMIAPSGRLDSVLIPDTTLFRSVVLSYNAGKAFCLYNYDSEAGWHELRLSEYASPDSQELTIDSLSMPNILTVGGKYILTDSATLCLLIVAEGQSFDSVQLKLFSDQQRELRRPEHFVSCVLTLSDSLARATTNSLGLPGASICTNLRGQTMDLIKRFDVRRLPALVTVDSTNVARRVYLKQ